MTSRHTRIIYTGYKSEPIQTQTGIPQGSTLSPILFLFFISELLESFQDVDQNRLFGFGFVDDTSLVTWGPIAGVKNGLCVMERVSRQKSINLCTSLGIQRIL
jgi:hypothetical protein